MRPSKLRLKVRSVTAPLGGAWPMPMQGPQASSSTRAPAATMAASEPLSAIIFITCREPGEMTRLTRGSTRRSASTVATSSRSCSDELVQLPMQTWSTGLPASSRTGTTLSGLCGCAMRGSSVARSISTVSSYSASGSAASGAKSSARPCDSIQPRVTSSAGKTLAVAPSSVPMLVMVARSGTERVATPGPAYSNALPTPPFTLRRRSSSRMTSLALTHGRSAPVRCTLTTRGATMLKGSPAIAQATSWPPAPMASMPMPPQVGVWLSLPRSVLPGTPKRSRWTWWQMPLPGRLKTMP